MLLWQTFFNDDAEELFKHQAAVGRNWPTVAYIKHELAKEEPDLYGVAEAWYELDDDQQRLLWRAPSKGGCFTTEERRIIKEDLPK